MSPFEHTNTKTMVDCGAHYYYFLRILLFFVFIHGTLVNTRIIVDCVAPFFPSNKFEVEITEEFVERFCNYLDKT